MSNAGGMSTITRYTDMLAGNAVWNPWEPQGSFDALSTVTVPSGGVASITFAAIPNTYKHLQIRGIARTATSTQDFIVYKPNGNNISARHFLAGDGASASAGASTSVFDFGSIPTSSSTANIFGTYILDILDYTANKNKTLRQLNGSDFNGSGNINFVSGLCIDTTPMNSLTIATYNSTNFAQFSQFTLYGVR
jgi:hypothetical protein